MTAPVGDDGSHRTTARARWRAWYRGSAVEDVTVGLGRIDFGNRILIFGASVLVSALPLIIILSAFAGRRIDGDIVRHLGLNHAGQEAVSSLFRSAPATFNVAVALSLALSFAGTIAVASSVQLIYEQTYRLEHRRGLSNLARLVVWVLVLGGVLIADGTVSGPLRDVAGGRVVLGVSDLLILAAFFWWTAHVLLHGRVPWSRLIAPAIATAVLWIGLGVFSSFYFSSSLVSDSRLYGTVGVIFTLVAWFIAIGAIIALGAVIGEVGDRRRQTRHGREETSKESNVG